MTINSKLEDNSDPDQKSVSEPDPESGGEDDGSTEKEGDDSHLHEDQKAPTL